MTIVHARAALINSRGARINHIIITVNDDDRKVRESRGTFRTPSTLSSTQLPVLFTVILQIPARGLMATDALKSQVAAKWQESFHRLNTNTPGISGLMQFSEVSSNIQV